MTTYIITAEAVLAAIFWLVVSIGSLVAVFWSGIRDTVTERIALAGISMTAAATVCRIVRQGWINEGYLWTAAFLAFYVCSIVFKHWKRIHPQPRDKTP